MVTVTVAIAAIVGALAIIGAITVFSMMEVLTFRHSVIDDLDSL